MTPIWFLLAGMTAAAVLALLWPMSRRSAMPASEPGNVATETGFYADQLAEIERDLARGLIAPEEAEAARAEAARRLLRANRGAAAGDEATLAEPRLRQRRAAAAFALSTVPLVALLAYGLYGSPNLPSQTPADRQAMLGGDRDLLKAIGQIEAKLAGNPGDARGWAVLAPVYMRMGRFADAAHAYEAVARLKGDTPEVLGNWGEALVAAANGTVPPEAKAVFERALALDEKAAKPRFYLARAAEQAGDTAEAIRQLEALEAASAADAPWLGLVRETLARLKGEPQPEPAPPAGETAAGKPATADRETAIRGMVDGLDQRLASGGGTPEEWLRLARSRTVLGERDRAHAALARARTALKDDPAGLARFEAGVRELGLADQAPDAAAPGQGPAAHADTEAAVAAVTAMPPAERDAAIRGMVAGLDRRLAAKGGSADEWLRLVRSYSALGDRARATQALERARMALGADAAASGRLDLLAQELGLPGRTAKP